jgi:N-methylhydantoinase A
MRFGVDVGGTFTDVVAVSTDGISVSKLRSVPGGVPPTLWKSLGQLGGTEGAADALIHGTTVATNVLLERTGGRVVLVTTAGFEDLLWLRRQDRAALYELSRDHPPPVVDHGDVIGARERVGVEGVIDPLAGEEIVRVVQEVARRSPDAIAICLLFAFRDPTHERGLAEALRSKLSTVPVACSHEVLPVFREYERASTTVAEAYLRPAVGAYFGGSTVFASWLPTGGRCASSKPAVGRRPWPCRARRVGSKVRVSSAPRWGTQISEPGGAIGGIPLALPHILIETVGAGGGSVGWLDRGGALRVGPRSAGAVPGPACYSQGGEEPTVTDAALVLGWLDVEHPLADDLPLHRGLAERALAAVARAAGLSVERCAEGMIDIANAAMVRALRRVSVERGIDPRNMTLVAFGGAGPLFACRMAESLGMHRALIPPHPGVLSALGLASAPEKLEFVDSLHRSATELDARSVDSAFADLEANARRDLPGAELVRLADCRYPGQGYELTVPASGGGEQIAVAFHALHGERYGHADRDRPVDVVNVRLVAQRAADAVRLATSSLSEAPSEPIAHRAPLRGLPTGTQLRGPIMLDGVDATARIEPGWNGTVHESGTVILERA